MAASKLLLAEGLKIASRKSLLALKQSEIVKALLEKNTRKVNATEEPSPINKTFVNIPIKIVKFSTKADASTSPLSVSTKQYFNEKTASSKEMLAKIPSSLLNNSSQPQGVFVKELEQALLNSKAHLAVHSLKDMPFKQPKGLLIAAYLKRDDVRDIALFNKQTTLQTLPVGAVVGTSSLRRILLLKKKYPHLKFKGIRGNVQARIKKLESKEFSAIVLASAGLNRLAIKPKYFEVFPVRLLPPAPGQGIIAVQTTTRNSKLKKLLEAINCESTMLCALAERRAMHILQTGCTLPFAAHATLYGSIMKLNLVMARLELHRIKRCTVFSRVLSKADANALGRLAAAAMKKKFRR